jgi:hypothetical protein
LASGLSEYLGRGEGATTGTLADISQAVRAGGHGSKREGSVEE